MNFFKRRRFLKRANLLDLTPVRMFTHETDDSGKVVLLIKKFRSAGLSRFALGSKSPVLRIKLDETGSEVWKNIDGVSNVATLLERLNTIWSDSPEKAVEMERRLAGFLSIMYDNRYIGYRELGSGGVKR
jgi:hypothetical protein